MAWTDLKVTIDAIIKANGNQEITGALLQSAIHSIIDQVGGDASYVGIATPATAPGVPDGNPFYFAYEKGVYSNFNGYVHGGGNLVILNWNGSNWAATKTEAITANNGGLRKVLNNTIAGSYINDAGLLVGSDPGYRVKVYAISGGDQILISGNCRGSVAYYSFYTDAACTTLVATAGSNSGTSILNEMVITPAGANYVAISEPNANDEYFVYTPVPIQFAISDLRKSVEQLDAQNKTYQTKKILDTEIANALILQYGTVLYDFPNYRVLRYKVTAGEKIRIYGKEAGAILAWCFYSDSSLTGIVQTGQNINSETDIDTIVQVPLGATYIGLTDQTANEAYFVDVYEQNDPNTDLTLLSKQLSILLNATDVFAVKETTSNVIDMAYIQPNGILQTNFPDYRVKVYDVSGKSEIRLAGHLGGAVMVYGWYSDAACTVLVSGGDVISGVTEIDKILEVKSNYIGVTDLTNSTAEMDIYSRNATLPSAIYDLWSSINILNNEVFNAKQYISADGDSLTAGAGGNGITYLNTLKNLLGENFADNNLGVGGETTYTIGARINSIPGKLKNNILIPATTTAVQVGTYSDSGMVSSWDDLTLINPLMQGDGSINPVIISGVEGILAWTGSSLSDPAGTWTFTRSAIGGQKQAYAGTPIFCNAGRVRRGDDFKIIYIGTNGVHSSAEDLINQIQAFIDYYDTSKYLIIGLHYSGGPISTNVYDLAMQKKFGSKFFNNRHYMITNAIQDAIDLGLLSDNGTYPTAQDIADISAGYPPTSLRSDAVHFNAIGYELMGRKLYEIGKNIGYW